ncbi:MAG: rod shape-determining protein [Planctomycetes bacterium]|nr:rod shape-determining protein [Planctomycetota bacterium]
MSLIARLMGMVSQDIGIDLGTANTVVCTRREGIKLNEPSVVAVRKGTDEVLMNGEAVGNVAKKMLDKVPGNIEAIRPMKSGVIDAFRPAEAMMAYFINKVNQRSWGIRPRVVVSIPMGITGTQKRNVVQACEHAGAREVYLIEQPMAAALGAALPIGDACASMIVDIGGGTTDVAVISMSGCVAFRTLGVAGDNLNEAVIRHMKEHYDLLVGEQTAERIKIGIGSVWNMRDLDMQEMRLEVSGRSTITELPARVDITSIEVREALLPEAMKIVDAIKDVLRRTPPELAADLVDRGIVLAGGGAKLRGLNVLIERLVALPVRIDNEPLYSVARGTAEVTKRFDELIDVLEYGGDIH